MFTTPLILRLDISGAPVRWISWEDAVCLYSRGLVAWTAGENEFVIHGGIARGTGQRSRITVHSIVAIKRTHRAALIQRSVPPLSNHELFRRDGFLCLYCGTQYAESLLTRDHIQPISSGGLDVWSNVVAACRSCNTRKGGRRPEQAKMPLLAVPYVPNWAEFLALSNRRILADQMDFLRTQFKSRARGPETSALGLIAESRRAQPLWMTPT
jgi:5-methylcytosine-specific restriction endonuclease McrA